MNNLRSSTSRSQMSSKTDTVNKEEISVVSSEKNWQNWNLPLVPQNKIYKRTS